MIDVRTPAARSTDPEPSHEAAHEITESGERQRQQEAVADAVRRYPGRTSHELAQATGMDRYAIARRLSECVTAKVVEEPDDARKRKCRVSGKKVTTWWPVPQQARLVA